MKNWTKPTITFVESSVVKSGGAGPQLYEKYVNLGSGASWPCDVNAGGCFTTASFYNYASGIAASTLAACNQAGGAVAPTIANCS